MTVKNGTINVGNQTILRLGFAYGVNKNLTINFNNINYKNINADQHSTPTAQAPMHTMMLTRQANENYTTPTINLIATPTDDIISTSIAIELL